MSAGRASMQEQIAVLDIAQPHRFSTVDGLTKTTKQPSNAVCLPCRGKGTRFLIVHSHAINEDRLERVQCMACNGSGLATVTPTDHPAAD